jgi:hypothetical protein
MYGNTRWEFCDGETWCKHEVFFTKDKCNIGLSLYFNEIEVGLKLLYLYISINNK